ncbi:hypothetical protein [Nakamurella multipartita]|uniref:Uncharacterized protein n=1 Tax=Nakamurella multipartita (strain ATCC 700099 / DSM 44233 / CIP 104796 / JCM 9543 / NBRC 105858 / Y-104) TaxID=479431 RepID=C8X8J4_NAKMY|nr:hypothetical protein [Nakamurella multipartita]ACV79049.1 hypothetical protein Namu_2703 [Nakamurella multipartita DSM 44233]
MTDIRSTPVGIIDSPGLVSVLTAAGIPVVTGSDFRDSVRAIRERSKQARSADEVPVIIARWRRQHVGMGAWLNSISGHTPPGKRTVVLIDPDDQPPTITGAEILPLPANLSALVTAAGFDDHPTYSDKTLHSDGSVHENAADFQIPDLDDDPEWTQPPWPEPEFDDSPSDPTSPAARGPAAGASIPAWAIDADPPPAGRPSAAPVPAWAEMPVGSDESAPPTPVSQSDLVTRSGPAILDPEPDPLPVLAAAPARPATVTAPPVTGDDLLDLMAGPRAAATPGSDRTRRRGQLGHLVISWAARGGAAKTSIALALAQRAGQRCPDLQVTVVDANRGQSDITKYLRLARPTIPGIFDAAVTGDPARAVLTMQAANDLRPGRWFDELHFHLIPGPRSTDEADPTVVTSDVYAQVIEQAQLNSDLVIVDTQIVEAHDTSGLIDNLAVPLLATPGVWGIANTDSSSVGVSNLADRLSMMAAAGVGREHMLMVINKSVVDFSEDDVRQRFSPYVCDLERIGNDDTVVEMMNNGRIPSDHAVYAAALDRILHRITGRPEFRPAPRPRRSILSWRRRGHR